MGFKWAYRRRQDNLKKKVGTLWQTGQICDNLGLQDQGQRVKLKKMVVVDVFMIHDGGLNMCLSVEHFMRRCF